MRSGICCSCAVRCRGPPTACSPSASRGAGAAMIEAPHFSAAGAKKKTVALPPTLFDGTVNQNALHRAVVTYLANQRQGTHNTKTRSEVSGGNQKPWRQKGTGRARTRPPTTCCGRTLWWSSSRRSRARGRPRRPRPGRRRPMPELHQVIVRPLVTEKSSAAFQANKTYTFKCHPEATKPQIKAAIETLFKV